MTTTVMCLITALLMSVVGIGFCTGKALRYIKGYQTTPEEEKSKINIKPLCRNLGAVFFIAAAIFGAAGISEIFCLRYFKWAIIAWLALGCADVLYIGKSKRFISDAATVNELRR